MRLLTLVLALIPSSLLLFSVDRATYGGATDGFAWDHAPETRKLKEALASYL